MKSRVHFPSEVVALERYCRQVFHTPPLGDCHPSLPRRYRLRLNLVPVRMNFLSYINEKFVKDKMNVSCIRHTQFHKTEIKKVAVLGGSGSFAISAAKKAGADILVTADLKYHDFFSAENEIILADIGHYESEQYTKNYLVDYLSKKITNFAVVLSTANTNPVKYF